MSKKEKMEGLSKDEEESRPISWVMALVIMFFLFLALVSLIVGYYIK